MSTWNLGYADVSEEQHAIRNQMASKDSQIAAQQTQLLRQAAEMEELKRTMNEALYKLNHETARALQLENDLTQRNEELRNEKIACQNVQTALAATHEKMKVTALGTRDLEATLESLSHTSDTHRSRCLQLEREKTTLEARVRELQTQTQQSPLLPKPYERSRPRSSSLSNFKLRSLEQDLDETRNALQQKEKELQDTGRKLVSVQNQVIKLDNEKQATEKKMFAQIHELQSSLEEREEELNYLREQEGDTSREQALLKRIEEDDAKITALETMLNDAQDVKNLEIRLKNAEVQLKEERHSLEEAIATQLDLSRQKEDILETLRYAQGRVQMFERILSEKDVKIDERQLNRSMEIMSKWNNNESATSSTTSSRGKYDDFPHDSSTAESTVAYIERLLSAIDRLRVERDDLRRDVDFLESESKFAIEALEAKLSASITASLDSDETMATMGQMKAEMDALHAQASEAAANHRATILAKSEEVNRLGLSLTVAALVIDHLSAQIDKTVGEEIDHRVKEWEDKLDVIVLCLEATTSQRDDLLVELHRKEKDWEMEVQNFHSSQQETMENIAELSCQAYDLTKNLEDVESERNSLAVQVANLQVDLQNAQDELGNAESRYSSLQFHQLSTMSSNEATYALREQIEELEMRVLRRNEQLGMHQHDIRRLETNLRLQEERLSEITMEMEMLSAQKAAMVEDCADAREVRDEALKRVEALEDEIEGLEGVVDRGEEAVLTLIQVVVETVAKGRDAILSVNTSSASRPCPNELAQLMHSLDLARDELGTALLSNDTLGHEKSHLEAEVTSLRTQLQDREKQVLDLHSSHTLVVEESDKQKACYESRTSELLAQIRNLETSGMELELLHQKAIGHLEGEINQLKERHDAIKHLTVEAEAVKRSQNDGLRQLESRFAAVTQTLAEVQGRHKSEVAQSQEQREAAIAAKDALELRLKELQDNTSAIEDNHRTEVLRLQDNLAKELQNVQQYRASCQALETDKATLLEDISSIKEALLTAHRELESQKSALEAMVQKSEVVSRELVTLKGQFQDEQASRTRDRGEHQAAVLAQKEDADVAIRQLEVKLRELQDAYQGLEAKKLTSDLEKLSLQEEATNLVSDIQRKKSLQRSLENQLKESEQTIAVLKSETSKIGEALAKSEQLNSKAIVNMSLLTAQHKREMADIQRDIQNLRSRPKLDLVVTELKERNEEMEELLRKKCMEIEENDDRALEMLKENKKLNSKVESLTRKIQTLQTKLATLKAWVPKTADNNAENGNSFMRQDHAVSMAPMVRTRSTTISSIQGPSNSTNPRVASNRVVSGPSSLPRPKTPERHMTHAPVFKARTPEKTQGSQSPETPSSVIGKKRRAPDDFETCESLPPQAFTADSLPGSDTENRTPRVRRVLSSLQTGFTPVRHLGRPVAPMPSPRRQSPSVQNSPFISDVTNNPLVVPPLPSSAKSSKRSWLGKIRGVSTQAISRSSRPVMD